MIPRYDVCPSVSRRPRFILVEERETEEEIDPFFAAHAASQELNASIPNRVIPPLLFLRRHLLNREEFHQPWMP